MATKTHHVWYPRYYRMYDGFNGHGNELIRHSQGSRRIDRWRTGVAVANWQQKIQDGQNATSDMTAEFWSVADEKPMVCKSRYRINPFGAYFNQDFEGHIVSYYTNFPVWVEYNLGAENRAKTKFFKAVRDAQVKLQGLVVLGELRETLRMLRRPAEGLQDLIRSYLDRARALKRGKGRGGARNFDQALSKLWLEYAFGWTPLLNDIYDARNAFNSLLERERIVKVSVGGRESKEVGPTSVADINVDHGGHLSLRCKDILDYTDIVRYRGAVRARAATTARDRFARFGFDPKEFIPTAWELLPWSFLIDYFANIGEILESSITDTSSVIWVSKSRVRIVNLYRSGFLTNPSEKVGSSNVQSYSSSIGWVYYHRRYVQRWATSGLTIPTLSFRLPVSGSKLTNMLALADIIGRSIVPQPIRNRNWRI